MRAAVFLAVAAAAVAACASRPPERPLVEVPRVPPAAGAAANAAAGAALYAVAGGCKIAGCPGGLACNPRTELCERVPCAPTECAFGADCPPWLRGCTPAR